jgi:hypothetical protein
MTMIFSKLRCLGEPAEKRPMVINDNDLNSATGTGDES